MKVKNMILLLVISVLVILSACSSKESNSAVDGDSSVPKEITFGYMTIPNQELLTKALGLVEEKYPDTEVKWIQFESSRDVNTAMAAGELDFGLVGTTGAATGIAQGLPYSVYTIHDVIGENEALLVQKDAKIKSLEDLTGKTVAVPFGSTTHFSLLSVLEKEGIDASKVKILDMQPSDMYAAWQRGDIDAGFVWQPTLEKMIIDNGEILLTSKQLAEEGIITADVGIVSKDFAKQYPEVVKTYVSLLNEAVNYYRDSPEEAGEALSKELSISLEETKSMMNELIWLDLMEQADSKYLGSPDQPGELSEVLKQTGDFMVEQKAIPTAPELSAYEESLLTEPLKDA